MMNSTGLRQALTKRWIVLILLSLICVSLLFRMPGNVVSLRVNGMARAANSWAKSSRQPLDGGYSSTAQTEAKDGGYSSTAQTEAKPSRQPLDGGYFSLNTRSNLIEYLQTKPSTRVAALLEVQHKNIQKALQTNYTGKPINILIWPGRYWFVSWGEGKVVKNCNIPCHISHDEAKASSSDGIVAMIDTPADVSLSPQVTEMVANGSMPLLGITWENHMVNQNKPRFIKKSVKSRDYGKIMPSRAAREFNEPVPQYDLAYSSSYELDSNIPITYPPIGYFAKGFVKQNKSQVMKFLNLENRTAGVFMCIGNSEATILPNRLWVLKTLGSYFPVYSYGNANRNETLREVIEKLDAKSEADRNYRSSVEILSSKLLFASAMENSMGTDYVSEKVFNVLSSGAVPIYNGAPNIVDFLPHPDAVIHLNQFKSIKELGSYLDYMSKNLTALYEKHHKWRESPLPDRMLKLVKFNDYNFPCTVCNCFAGVLESCKKKL